jgi:hypothetical protein
MKIDFDQTFEGVTGDGADKLTLGLVVFNCLNFVNPNSREALPLDQAIARGSMALRLKKGGQQDVDADEMSLLRSTLTTLVYPPFIVAQAAAMVDVPKS